MAARMKSSGGLYGGSLASSNAPDNARQWGANKSRRSQPQTFGFMRQEILAHLSLEAEKIRMLIGSRQKGGRLIKLKVNGHERRRTRNIPLSWPCRQRNSNGVDPAL